MKTKMTKAIYATLLMLFFTASMFAQTGSVGINNDGSSPNSKAMLDVSSTTKGFLPPRMTYSEKIAIASPPAGLIVWCSNCGTSGELQIYNGTIWTSLTAGTASGLPGAPTIGTATAGNAQASVPFTAPGSNGGSTILSYTATSSPGSITGTLTQAGSGTITVNGLTNGQAYTFTVTATNATGTGAASAASNSVTPLALAIGRSYRGGVIAYILQSGDPGYVSGEIHGLIAAIADQSTSIAWITGGSTQTTLNSNTSTAIGTGQANTNAMKAQVGYTGGAAKVCDDYVNSETGTGVYSDWYLPSKDELWQMFVNRVAIGGFDLNIAYWNSSQDPAYATNAWYVHFSNGNVNSWDKSYGVFHVRAVRSF